MVDNSFSRRDLLRRAALAGLLLPAAGVLSACASPAGGGGTTPQAPATGAKTASNPLGVPEDEPLEVVIFNGGFGDDVRHATSTSRCTRQASRRPRSSTQATQEIAKTLQPRFAGGNPPEFVNNSGRQAMDFGALVPGRPAPEPRRTAGRARAGTTPGRRSGTRSCPRRRRASARTTASLRAELRLHRVRHLVLQQALRRQRLGSPEDLGRVHRAVREDQGQGHRPVAYAGKRRLYMWRRILTHAAKIGGPDVLKNIDNLEDGAWKSDAVKQAADAWRRDRVKYTASRAPKGSTTPTPDARRTSTRWPCYPCGRLAGERAEGHHARGFKLRRCSPRPRLGGSDKLPADGAARDRRRGVLRRRRRARTRAPAWSTCAPMLSKEGAA